MGHNRGMISQKIFGKGARVLVGLLGVVLAFAVWSEEAARVPAGYRLVYEQSFDLPGSLGDFVMSDTNAWRHSVDEKDLALELYQQSKYSPPHRSPLNMALIAGHKFGDFILEVNMLQTGREYGHRDMCLFFGFQDPAHFYYVHIAAAADDNAHNVFIVNDAPRKNIATRTTAGVPWGQNVWQQIRVERRVLDGKIRVYWNDLDTPIMEATDTTFGPGYLGFGSFDDTGKVDNIRIWAPGIEKEPIRVFERAIVEKEVEKAAE